MVGESAANLTSSPCRPVHEILLINQHWPEINFVTSNPCAPYCVATQSIQEDSIQNSPYSLQDGE